MITKKRTYKYMSIVHPTDHINWRKFCNTLKNYMKTNNYVRLL